MALKDARGRRIAVGSADVLHSGDQLSPLPPMSQAWNRAWRLALLGFTLVGQPRQLAAQGNTSDAPIRYEGWSELTTGATLSLRFDLRVSTITSGGHRGRRVLLGRVMAGPPLNLDAPLVALVTAGRDPESGVLHAMAVTMDGDTVRWAAPVVGPAAASLTGQVTITGTGSLAGTEGTWQADAQSRLALSGRAEDWRSSVGIVDTTAADDNREPDTGALVNQADAQHEILPMTDGRSTSDEQVGVRPKVLASRALARSPNAGGGGNVAQRAERAVATAWSGWEVAAIALACVLVGAWGMRLREDVVAVVRGEASWKVWMALLFVPGLYVCLGVAGALAVGGALAVMGLLGWLFSFIHRMPVGLMFLIGVGGLTGLLAVLRAGLATVRRARIVAVAVKLKPEANRRLFRRLTEIATRVGCRMPDNVILEMGTGFYVTEAHVQTVDGLCKGRTLCLSAPLLHILREDQALAVIAHEFAHFTGGDTILSRRFYPVYTGTSTALQEMSKVADSPSENSGVSGLALILPMLLIGGYLSLFRRLERSVSRQRELRADSLAAQACDPAAMAGALVVISTVSAAWPRIDSLVAGALRSDLAFRSLALLFADMLSKSPVDTGPTLSSDAGKISHPTDSHPRLGVRLEALGYGTARAPKLPPDMGNAIAPPATGSGASLIDSRSEDEERLSDLYTAIIARRMAIQTSAADRSAA